MSNVIYPIITFTVSLLCTWVTMPLLLKFCHKQGLYDTPNARKVHHNNIPRLGGVLFAPALVMGIEASIVAMVTTSSNLMPISLSACLLFGAVFLVFCIGLVDDLVGMEAKIKFAIQLVASLCMPFCNLYINNLYGFCGIYEIPAIVGYPLTVFTSLLIINAINLIDGIDGLASGLSLITLGIFTFIFLRMDNVPFTLLTTGLMGALTVFMRYNLFGNAERHRKTFMGDTGSLILGFTFAYLCIKYAMFNPSAMPSQPCPILISYTLVLVPVFDLVRVAFERLVQGKGIFSPDKRHIHHLFLAAGFSMHQALACILALQVFYDVVNTASFYYLQLSPTWIVIFDIVSYALVCTLLKFCRKQQTTDAIAARIKKES